MGLYCYGRINEPVDLAVKKIKLKVLIKEQLITSV